MLSELDDHFGKLLAKYEQRGWTAERFSDSHFDKVAKRQIEGNRWVGDEKSWTISLQPTVQVDKAMPDSVLECSNFQVKLTGARDGGPLGLATMREAEIVCRPFEHPMLRHKYGYVECGWLDFLAKRLDRLCTLQLVRCKPEERPGGSLETVTWNVPVYGKVEEPMFTRLAGFSPPAWWKYVDDLMPKWRRQFLYEKKERERIEKVKESERRSRQSITRSSSESN